MNQITSNRHIYLTDLLSIFHGPCTILEPLLDENGEAHDTVIANNDSPDEELSPLQCRKVREFTGQLWGDCGIFIYLD